MGPTGCVRENFEETALEEWSTEITHRHGRGIVCLPLRYPR